MAVQGWLVAGAFVALIAVVLTRVAILRRRGITAFLFGATHKSDAILVPCILLVLYAVAGQGFGAPMWSPLVAPYWHTPIPGWVGVVACWLAVAGLIWTLISFGDSFRVGIDDQAPAGLVTTGAFAHSRNPIYVCFFLFLLGLFLVQHNLVTTLVPVAFAFVVHRQVRREESFLEAHYGADFTAYCTTVRRYL